MQKQITWKNLQLSYKQNGYMQGGDTQTHTCKLIWNCKCHRRQKMHVLNSWKVTWGYGENTNIVKPLCYVWGVFSLPLLRREGVSRDICSKLLLSPKLMIEILKHQYNESLGENCCNPIQVEENCILTFLLWLFISFFFLMLQGRVLHKTIIFYLFVIWALSLLNPHGCTDADRPLQT